MATFEQGRAKILLAAELPLQRLILDRMPRLVHHVGNPNHNGDHVQDWDLPHAIGMTLKEAIVLYGLVRQSPTDYYGFWEVGTYIGWSTAFMAEALKKRSPLPGILHTFDAWEKDHEELATRFMENILYWNPRVTHWGGKTPGSFSRADGLGHLPVLPDFVLVDGGHHHGQPRADVDGVLELDRLDKVPTFVFHDAWIQDVQDANDYLEEDHDCACYELDTVNRLTVVTKDDRMLEVANQIDRLHNEDLTRGTPWQ